MPSVSELVEDIAEIMKEAPESVNAYARALIDAGLLPKSRGRAIAQVTPLDIVTLFSAVCLEPKIKDAAETVSKYLGLRVAGVPLGAPSKISFTAGDYLAALATTILTDVEAEDDKKSKKTAFDSNIVFCRSWPQIEVKAGGQDGGATMVRFKEGSAFFWEGYHKRETVLSGRAILMMGINNNRTYRMQLEG